MLLETVYTVGEHEHCKLGQGHVMTLIHSQTSFISYLVTESIFVVITRLTGQRRDTPPVRLSKGV